MLSPDDARLIERDRELPGFRTVLDPDSCTDWLSRHYPLASIRRSRPRYVRYKPGTSCLAAHLVEWGDAVIEVVVKAHRPPAAHKLAKVSRLTGHHTVLGPAAVLDETLAISATVFPYDVRVRALHRLFGPLADEVMRALLPFDDGARASMNVLSYKPERRAVLRLEQGGARFVVRVYSEREFSAVGDLRIFRSGGARLAETLARDAVNRLTVTEWIEGDDGHSAFVDIDRAERIGEALARLHLEPCVAAPVSSAGDERRHLRAVAGGLADLLPRHAARLEHLASRISEAVASAAAAPVCIHGDFAARQVVLASDGVVLTDLDQAGAGHPAHDIGSFLADLDFRTIAGELSARTAEQVSAKFITGYTEVRPLPPGTMVYRAAALLRLAPLPFRLRQPGWPERIEQMICAAESLRENASGSPTPYRSARHAAGTRSSASDASMPWLNAALDPAYVTRLVADLPWAADDTSVRMARVRRHKPGRRCLVEYSLAGTGGPLVLGKTRAKGLDARTAGLNDTLARSGFGDPASDGIEVPPYLGVLPPLRMWMQAAVCGESAADALARGEYDVGTRLMEAVVKLQRRGPLPSRTHTLGDELHILESRLSALAAQRPQWQRRLARLLDGCHAVAATIRDAPPAPAHRDFYPDQLLVSGGRLFILDLDLYALAHPALDAGNCIAHVLEAGLRPGMNRGVLEGAAAVMRDSMAARAPELASAVDAFTTLTLVRLVAIDDGIEHRRVCVEPLLDMCEERVGRIVGLTQARSWMGRDAISGGVE